MNSKKLMLLCLSILMFLGMVGGFRLTANAATSGDYYYDSDDDYVTITGYKGKKSSVTIPSEIDGKKVIEIGGEAFESCEKLKIVTIPSSVERIAAGAFLWDDKLERINYKGTIAQWKKVNIDYTDNESLKGVTIYCTDGTIEQIKPTSFYNDKVGRSFVKISWDKISKASGYEIQLATDKQFTQNKKTVKIKKQNQMSIVVNSLKANQKYYMRGRTYKLGKTNVYSDWSAVQEVKLLAKKSNNKVSGDYEYSINKNNMAIITAYAGNKTEITIPSKLGGKKVIEIGEKAFEYYDLKSVQISKGIKKISKNAFRGCEELKKVVLPNTVTQIGDQAFSFCHNLKSINIPKGIKKINNGIFDECVKLKKITIPKGVTEIGELAFLHCSELTELNIPKSVKKIGSEAFYGCGFKSITIPDGVKEITYGMLSDCQSLKEVVLPDSITQIGDYAFYFTKIKNIKISKNVKKIGGSAFSSCDSLASVQYTGTKKQWQSVKIGNDNTDLKSAMIYCKDGTINNKGVTVKNVTKAKKAVKVSWSKVSGVNGYKVQVATNSKFTKNVKTVLISTPKTTSVTVKGLKSNQKYYVRMCTYKVKKVAENASVKLYYPWSKTKSVTTK